MEIFLLPLKAMGAVFIANPIFAIVPVIIYFGLFAVSKKFSVLLASLLWLAYLSYEYAIKLRILCSGECNIRVDLLLIYPLLLVVSIVAIIAFARSRVNSTVISHLFTGWKWNIRYVYVGIVLITAVFAAYAYRQHALGVARTDSPVALQQLSKEFWVWYDPEVLTALALNEATPQSVRAAIARNAIVPTDTLSRLMGDRYVEVRKAAATNPRTTAAGLRTILTTLDGSPEVKFQILAHPNTPCDVLRELATDHNDRIQQLAARRLVGCPATTVVLSVTTAQSNASRSDEEPNASAIAPDQSGTPACAHADDIVQSVYSHCVQRVRDQLAADKRAPGTGQDVRVEALTVAIDRGDVEIANLLLNDGLDLNKRSREGKTPLILAASLGRNEIIKALLAHGAEINQRGATIPDADRTALMRAVESDRADTVKILLAHGADPLLADLTGWTAIHYAAKDGHRQSLEVLVAYGVDVNLHIGEGTHAGQTPLIAAAYFGHVRTLTWLLEHGADPALSDRYGYTALRLAHERGNEDAVTVLSRMTEK